MEDTYRSIIAHLVMTIILLSIFLWDATKEKREIQKLKHKTEMDNIYKMIERKNNERAKK